MRKLIFTLILTTAFSIALYGQKTRTITIITQPGAAIWIDEIKRGIADDKGKFMAKFILPGAKKLRIRAMGYKEANQPITSAQSEIKVALLKTTDEAELTFQKAEAESDKEKAKALYEKAIKLRPKYAEAYLGLARVLNDLGDSEEALKAIANARKARPAYAEASAIEGRIHKNDTEEAKAIASFKRAIKEGGGIQPEAFTGLGLLYKEKGENAAAMGDFDSETLFYTEAAKSLQSALSQLGATEPTLYEMLGTTYEKMQKYKEAIAVYEEFIRMFPDSNEITTYRSYITQARKRIAGQ
jgi:tetratricopeptide (TPR) repeat protein